MGKLIHSAVSQVSIVNHTKIDRNKGTTHQKNAPIAPWVTLSHYLAKMIIVLQEELISCRIDTEVGVGQKWQ